MAKFFSCTDPRFLFFLLSLKIFGVFGFFNISVLLFRNHRFIGRRWTRQQLQSHVVDVVVAILPCCLTTTAFLNVLGLSELLFLLNFSFFVPGRVGFFYPLSTSSIGPKILPLRCWATGHNLYYFASCI